MVKLLLENGAYVDDWDYLAAAAADAVSNGNNNNSRSAVLQPALPSDLC